MFPVSSLLLSSLPSGILLLGVEFSHDDSDVMKLNVPRRGAGSAGGAEPDGELGGRGGRGGRGCAPLRGAPVGGHGGAHDALAALPATVQDAARVVPLRLRRERDRWYTPSTYFQTKYELYKKKLTTLQTIT